MADIKATFLADFDPFNKSAAAATNGLTTFGGGALKASTSIAAMEQSADRAAPKVRTIKDAFATFDGVLASMGVNIGAHIRGLTDIGDASGKTASQLGLVGVAGLAVGAGVAGWKIGRAVAEFFDLDTKIANATSTLLGWGDAAGQAAGAKADVLALASRRIGFEVLSLSTALEINNAYQGKWQTNAKVSADTVTRWQEALAKVTASGDLPQLTKDLESGNFSIKELAQRYGVAVEALQFFQRETKKTADAEKATADGIHANNERLLKDHQAQIDATADFKGAMDELNSSGKGWLGTLETIDGTVVEAIKSYLAAGVSQAALAKAYGLTDTQVKSVASALRDETDEQKRATAAREAHTRAINENREAEERANAEKLAAKKRADELAEALGKLAAIERARGGSTEYDLSTAAGRAKVPPDIAQWLHNGYSLEQAARLAFALKMGFDISRDPLFAQKGPRVPGFASGVQNFGGGLAMVGERGPELVHLPAGSSVFPHGSGGGGVINHFYLVDNSENLARKVSGLIMRSLSRTSKVGS